MTNEELLEIGKLEDGKESLGRPRGWTFSAKDTQKVEGESLGRPRGWTFSGIK